MTAMEGDVVCVKRRYAPSPQPLPGNLPTFMHLQLPFSARHAAIEAPLPSWERGERLESTISG
jgi:hypothetical protein